MTRLSGAWRFAYSLLVNRSPRPFSSTGSLVQARWPVAFLTGFSGFGAAGTDNPVSSGQNKSTACGYDRARPGGPVAMPLQWPDTTEGRAVAATDHRGGGQRTVACTGVGPPRSAKEVSDESAEALAKPPGSQSGTGILPVIHGRPAHATRGFARA